MPSKTSLYTGQIIGQLTILDNTYVRITKGGWKKVYRECQGETND